MGLRLIVLFGFVPLGLAMFRLYRPHVACLLALLISAMFLPERTEFDLPLLPPLSKHTMGTLVALAGCAWAAPRRILPRNLREKSDWVLLALLLSALATALTNGESTKTVFGSLQGLSVRDAISMAVRDLLWFVVPFYLGRNLVRSPRELRTVLSMLAGAGLIYAILVLYESRMSPQLHKMVYGFHPNNFGKSLRLGGYRPMVFMQSGLAVAIFMLTSTMAGFALARARLSSRWMPSRAAAALLAFALVVCRSLGTLLYAAFVLPVLVLLSRRGLRAAILGLALLVSVYPALRALHLFPTESIVSLASKINADRAESLGFRFENENEIVDRSGQKLLFGWGGYDRSMVSVKTGYLIRAADGFWVIQLGQRGVVGLGLTIGLLVWPLFRAVRRLPRVTDPRAHALLGGLALIVAIRAFDMMPNGMYGVLPFFLAGALFGVTDWSPTSRRGAPRAARDRSAPPRPLQSPPRIADLLG